MTTSLTILATTDCIPAADLANCVTVTNRVITKWSPNWGISALVTTDPTVKADMVEHITQLHVKSGALGYHDVENGEPTAYDDPAVIHNGIYGYYKPAVYNTKVVGGKIIHLDTIRTPARYGEGVITVFVHEILEMLADGHIDQLSAPDSLGLNWMVEVCDHVSGYYGIELINGHNAVVPDATFRDYYNLKGSNPRDLYGHSLSAFDTTSPSFYGFTKDTKTHKETAILKNSIHH